VLVNLAAAKAFTGRSLPLIPVLGTACVHAQVRSVYWRLHSVLVRDDDGHALDAEYSVERDGDFLAVLLESASGPSGSRPARNTDYRKGQAILLDRLRALGAVLHDALVDSRYTRRNDIPEAEVKGITSSGAEVILTPNVIGVRQRRIRARV
jgi:hypothetical protein